MRTGRRLGRAERAVLLDRDGTLVYPRHYPSQPAELVLYPGVASELRALQQAGFRLVVVTNQSGIARGLFTEEALARMHEHLAAELGRAGVQIDGWYYCPHHPDGCIPELARRCECRKPQPGMLLRAARELRLDLGRSWMIGDILADVEAGNRAGCRTVLVDLGTEAPPEGARRVPSFVARDTHHALRLIRSVEQLGPPAELAYLPEAWQGRDVSLPTPSLTGSGAAQRRFAAVSTRRDAPGAGVDRDVGVGARPASADITRCAPRASRRGGNDAECR